jgi:hypothetical protein
MEAPVVLQAKDRITTFFWRNADGPMDVEVYGRYTTNGLVIHGLTLDNTYSVDHSPISRLPPAMMLLPLVITQVRRGLLNGETITITTPAGRPAIDSWYGLLKRDRQGTHCHRGYGLEWRPRGRPLNSGRFANADDFRMTVIQDLRILRAQGLPQTQQELASFWCQQDHNSTAVVDSLVSEIKRYCQKWGSWKQLREASEN